MSGAAVPARTGRRRGFILVAVMIVSACAIFIATSLLFIVQSDVAASAGALDAAQSRALGWSGIQVVMSELNDQREVILDGERPQLARQFVIFETESELGVVRMLPIGGGRSHLIPEAGKIDLNHNDAETLARTGLIDEVLARQIVEYRDVTMGRPFQSVGELLRVPGVTPSLLYGALEDLRVLDDAMFAAEEVGDRLLGLLDANQTEGLADVVTVHGFEPALQRSGKLRINLNVDWSDDLHRRIADRFGSDAANVLQQIIQSGTKFDNEAKVVEVLRFFQVAPEDWPDVIDSFTTEPHEYHVGRVDINTAPFEALMALPGITPDQANAIVRLRDRLPREERWSTAWPLIQGILAPEAYDDLAGRITTRSWTWRVRLAAGTVAAEDPDGPLISPVIHEAVIDLSAPRARVAYLREVTMLQTAAMLVANASFADEPDLLADRIPPSEEGAAADESASPGGPLDDADDGVPSPPGDRNGGSARGGDVGDGSARDGDADGPDASAGGRRNGSATQPADSGSNTTPARPRRIGRWTRGG